MANYNWSTKIQAYLAKIAGKEVDNLPEPTTKEQALLKEIAEGGGSTGGGLVVHVNDGTLDKTWQEIHDAMSSGSSVVIDGGDDFLELGHPICTVLSTAIDGDYYCVSAALGVLYRVDSTDGYPVHVQ